MQFRFLLFAILVAAPVWSVGCKQPPTQIRKLDKAEILPVRVVHVERRTGYTYPMTFYGRINATRESGLSFELAGLVSTIEAEEGDHVKKNQILATLDTNTLNAQRQMLVAKKNVEESLLRKLKAGEREEVLTAARAAVERFKVETKSALLHLQREVKLRQTNSIPIDQYETTKYEYESLKFSLDEQQARLDELESGPREEDIEAQERRVAQQEAEVAVLDTQISKTNLLAPFDGHIVKKTIDNGTVVAAGQSVLIVSESGSREARFSFPAPLLDQMADIQAIFVEDQAVPVVDFRIVQNVDATTRTVDVVLELEPNDQLVAGETCIVTLLKRNRKDCVALPLGALVPSVRGLWSCYRIEQDPQGQGFLIIKEDVMIDHTDGNRAYVETTLPDDAIVVSEGVHKLVPGMRVRPIGETP